MKSLIKREGTTVKRGLTVNKRMSSKEQGNEKKSEERNFVDEKHLRDKKQRVRRDESKGVWSHERSAKKKGRRDSGRAGKR